MLLRKLQKDNRIERETWIKRHKEEQGESNVYRKTQMKIQREEQRELNEPSRYCETKIERNKEKYVGKDTKCETLIE